MSTGKKNLVLVMTAGLVVLWGSTAQIRDATSDASEGPEGELSPKIQPRGVSFQVGDVEQRKVDKASGGSLRAHLQTLTGLGIVVVLIFLTRVVLRRFGRPMGAPRTTGPVELLSRTRVSPRQELLLVRLGRRLVLVGCSPEGFSALSEVADADEQAGITAEFNGAREDPATRRYERTERAAGAQEPAVDTVRDVTNRIRRYCRLEGNQR